MKNLAIRLTVALITFTVGVLPVMVWHELTRDPFDAWMEEACAQRREPCASPSSSVPHADRPGEEGLLPVLAYCELVGNPERYDGKIVRVRATLRMSIHGLFLSDVTCDRYENYAAVDFHEPRRKELVNTFFGPDNPTLDRPGPVELIAIGRFEKVFPSRVYDSLLDNAPLRFEMMRVEKMHVEKAPVVEHKARKVAR